MTSSQRRADFRTALRDNSDDLLAYFERRAQSRDDAADMLGDTFLQAWRRFDAFPEGSVRQRMWLFKIASNVLANHSRSLRRKRALAVRVGSALSREEHSSDHAEAGAVRDAVRRLPRTGRELVILVHWDGFSILEAAEILGINPSTARTRYATARAQLRTALLHDPPGADRPSGGEKGTAPTTHAALM